MPLSLSSFTECILNPNDRFKTLRGIYSVTGEDGEPSMSLAVGSVDFGVIFREKQFNLKCFYPAEKSRTKRLKNTLATGPLCDSKFVAGHSFYEAEMLLFDSFDKPVWLDVLLQRIPGGTRLDRILKDTGKNTYGSFAARPYIAALADLAQWISLSRYSCFNLSAANIFFTAEALPVIPDITSVQEGNPGKDIIDIACLAATIYFCSCEPGLYCRISGDQTRGRTGPDMLTRLKDILEKSRSHSSFTEYLRSLIMYSQKKTIDTSAICDLIYGLSTIEPRPLINTLASIEPDKSKSDKPKENLDGIIRSPHTNSRVNIEPENFNKYKYVGNISEDLVRVWDGVQWSYLDPNANPVITGNFTHASDFAEGRSVIETADGYGLIDTRGKFIMEPVFDDLQWDSANDLAVATREGLSGIFTRDGKSLTGLVYDQLLDCSEGIMAAKKKGKFGYISRSGKTVIEHLYDDAFSFKNGVARVRLNGTDLLIDRKGFIVGTVDRGY